MKMLVSDTEVDIEFENEDAAALEWTWTGNHLHAKLIRGEPYKNPLIPCGQDATTTLGAHRFEGVTPGMEEETKFSGKGTIVEQK